jgi:hypothetical protein
LDLSWGTRSNDTDITMCTDNEEIFEPCGGHRADVTVLSDGRLIATGSIIAPLTVLFGAIPLDGNVVDYYSWVFLNV